MEIKFSNEKQCNIADMIWQAEDCKEVNRIVNIFGHDGYVVYNMILAHHLDTKMETDLAQQVLEKIKYGT